MVKSKKQLTTKATKTIPVTRGSGNIFVDLGFEDAEELQIKAGLTHQICDRIKALSLTQVQAAAQLDISQPDVSKLIRGRYTGFTTDRLITLLNALQVDVDIVVRMGKSNGVRHKGRVRILKEVLKEGDEQLVN